MERKHRIMWPGCCSIWNPTNILEIVYLKSFDHKFVTSTDFPTKFWSNQKLLKTFDWNQSFDLKTCFDQLVHYDISRLQQIMACLSWFWHDIHFFMIIISFFHFVAHKFMNTAWELAWMWAFLFCSELVYVYIYIYNIDILHLYIYKYIWEAL